MQRPHLSYDLRHIGQYLLYGLTGSTTFKVNRGGKKRNKEVLVKSQIWSLLGLLCSLSGVPAAQTSAKIEPRADELLRAACQFLADTPAFSLTAEVWREHIADSGEKVQFTRQVD